MVKMVNSMLCAFYQHKSNLYVYIYLSIFISVSRVSGFSRFEELASDLAAILEEGQVPRIQVYHRGLGGQDTSGPKKRVRR